MSDSINYPAGLGRPLNANSSQNSSAVPISSQSSTAGGALSASGAAGDYVPNPFGHSSSTTPSGGAAAGELGGSGGEGRDTSYEITNPKSGYQALGDGEAEPHAAHREHSAENSARRNDTLVDQTEHHHHSSVNGIDGITSAGFVATNKEHSNHQDASTATLASSSNQHSGAGVPLTTGLSAAASGSNSHAASQGVDHTPGSGAHSVGTNSTPTHTKDNTSGGPNDLTIGGFNPKLAASDLDPTLPAPKEVEHLSTDGPHGLVWKESEGKYVHRREL